MAYIFKQKLQIQDLVDLNLSPKKILIYEPESYLAGLYGHYLKVHNFDVKHCPNLSRLKEDIINFSPELLVYSVENQKNLPAKNIFPINFKKEFPNLIIITTGYNINNEEIKKVMNYGACSHINRHLTHPQDLAVLARTLFNN